jgi:hypothetical protein
VAPSGLADKCPRIKEVAITSLRQGHKLKLAPLRKHPIITKIQTCKPTRLA